MIVAWCLVIIAGLSTIAYSAFLFAFQKNLRQKRSDRFLVRNLKLG